MYVLWFSNSTSRNFSLGNNQRTIQIITGSVFITEGFIILKHFLKPKHKSNTMIKNILIGPYDYHSIHVHITVCNLLIWWNTYKNNIERVE